MLQEETPDDYVIATGRQHSVREFVELAGKELGVDIRWEGRGVEEKGVVMNIDPERLAAVNPEHSVVLHAPAPGRVVVRIDTRYFRPTEVDTLLGDPRKAKEKLGWEAKTSFESLVSEMVRFDLEEARRDEYWRRKGFRVNDYYE